MRGRILRITLVLAGGLIMGGCEKESQEKQESAGSPAKARQEKKAAHKTPLETPSYKGQWWTAKPSPCPDGAMLKGTPPPAGREVWCEDAEGKRHGPRTRWWNPAVVRAIKRTSGPRQGERVEVVNAKGKVFEADLVVTDTKAGSDLKQEEGAWMHGKREGRHVQWGVSGQVDLDTSYRDGIEQKKGTGP